jgi:hypothetical protein
MPRRGKFDAAMSAQTFAPTTFAIPISSGILAHCQKIGIALWVFIWLIDRTTREVPSANGCTEGLVYGGRAIRAHEIGRELEMPTRTVQAHLDRLVAYGYLRRINHAQGVASGYAVLRSKKWKPKLPILVDQEPASTAQNSADLRRKPALSAQDSAQTPPFSAQTPPFSAQTPQNSAPYKEDITQTLQGLLLGMPPVPSEPSHDGGTRKAITEDEGLAEIWDYYREKLNRSSTYAFTKKRRSMGEQGLSAARKLASEKGSITPRQDAVNFLKLAIDRLAKEPYHNGANDQGTKYLDWEHLFRGKDKECPQKLVEYWLDDSSRRWAE